MISVKTRIIREANRLYKNLLYIQMFLIGNKHPKVLLFHEIKSEESGVNNIFQISKSKFKSCIEQLKSSSSKPMTFRTLSEVVLEYKYVDEDLFIISFDDIYDSVYSEAYPILKREQIPFILFVTCGLIGKPGYVTLDHLKEMSHDSLCTIGSHGMEHSVFRNLSVQKAKESMLNSKSILEKMLGVTVTCFAFPYGRRVECSFKNIKILKECGAYQFGFSAMSGTLKLSGFTGRYFLPRINVDDSIII